MFTEVSWSTSPTRAGDSRFASRMASLHDMLIDAIRRARRFCYESMGKDVRVPVRRHARAIHLGSAYGGWTVRADLLNPQSVVWGAGVGQDISFDLALIERFGVSVHAFDPTPLSIEWLAKQKLPAGFIHHPVGLADFDGLADFGLPPEPGHVSFQFGADGHRFPVKRIDTIASELGQQHIDLLKMDIEGAELGVIASLAETKTPIRQLLVEFHHDFNKPPSVQAVRDAIATLHRLGYACFARSPVGRELSFIRET